MKILIIEDDATMAHMMDSNLAAKGHQTVFATDVGEALSVSKLFKPDVLVADWDLNDDQLDGIDVCRQFKKLDPNISLIFVSGASKDVLKDASKALSPAAIISKPFDFSELERALHHIQTQNSFQTQTGQR